MALIKAIKTKREPMSLAFFDSECKLVEIRSIIVSMAVLTHSANKMKRSEEISKTLWVAVTSNIKAIGVKKTHTTKSCLKAGSDLSVAIKPSYENLNACKMRLRPSMIFCKCFCLAMVLSFCTASD